MVTSQDDRTKPASPAIWFVYSLAVFFLLFFALGQRSLGGSEDRWAEIARNMLLHKDWFHPVINGEVYFDKPLVSYWLIVISAYCTNGLTELAVRLPGALSALVTIFCSYQIALRWFDRRVAWFTASLIITSYGFLFWSHTASAELSNLALITAAIAWFVHRKGRNDFFSYLFFYLLCAIGSQLKGLTAFVVPILVILPYLVRERRWKTHINLAHLMALVIAAGVFFLPYLGASWQPLPAGVEAQHNQLSGIELLIRENIVRFLNPFDHVAPFYSYLYEVPRILFPWMFLFLAALFHFGARYKKLDEAHRWLLEIIALIFLFFTLSGSRRWYYILPIIPYCMMLISAYIVEVGSQKWKRIAAMATLVVLMAGAMALLLFPVAVKMYVGDLTVPNEFLIGSALIALACLAVLLLGKNRTMVLQRLMPWNGSQPGLMPFLMLMAVVEMVVVFGFVLPGVDTYRQIKPFALSLSAKLGNNEKIAFYKTTNTTIAYYLNLKEAIPVISHRSELPASSGQWIVILEKPDREAFFNEFPDVRKAEPILSENKVSEKLPYSSTGLAAYRVD